MNNTGRRVRPACVAVTRDVSMQEVSQCQLKTLQSHNVNISSVDKANGMRSSLDKPVGRIHKGKYEAVGVT